MKHTYIIVSPDSGYISNSDEGISTDFKNPVSKGDFVYWSRSSGDLNGSYAGRVVDVEHHPDFSVIRVEPK